MTDNGALYRIADTAGGMQRSTRVSKGLAAAPTAAPTTMSVVCFAAGAAGGLASPTATAVTATTPLNTPHGDFAIQLRQITQGCSVGIGTPQSLEAFLTLAGAPKRGAGTQRTIQGAGTPTISGMDVLAPGQRAAEYRAASQPNQNTAAAGNTASPHDRGNVRKFSTEQHTER